jgi:long-chain fatty acid transport protein
MRNLVCATIAAAASLLPITTHATNGMNMDAWGAKSGGMGGASFGYDSGNSAVMNNPATLGLRPAERSEFGLGLTLLLPTVASSHPQAGSKESTGDLYAMPTISWIKRTGPWAYGAGLLAQGGMGTEYGRGSSLFAGGMSMNNLQAALSGEEIRSEVGVGRLMFPIAWQASDALTLAAQLDFVWATMDVKMDIDGSTFGKMVSGTPGIGSATGSLVNVMNGAISGGQITDVNYARFDFSDDNAFSGAARNTGWAGKLGIHYRVSENFSLGATWHSKTHIDDLKAKRANLQMGVVTPGGTQTVPVSGRLSVVDFQWPETYGIGFAWQATPKLMLVGDVKRIRWANSMKNFTLKFDADATQSNAMAQNFVNNGGTAMTAILEQHWKDHTIYMFGGQYMLRPDLALRAGINVTKNPVPDATLNPLFPATIRRHLSLGMGWKLDKEETLAFSLTYAPQVSNTNPGTGITSTHRQTTLRVNYNFMY